MSFVHVFPVHSAALIRMHTVQWGRAAVLVYVVNSCVKFLLLLIFLPAFTQGSIECGCPCNFTPDCPLGGLAFTLPTRL